MSLPPGHITSAISAVAQGQLTQLRIIVEDIYERLGEEEVQLPDSEKEKMATSLQSIELADPPSDDAKSVDVREAVIDLTEKFNQVLTALKGE